jgi:hypothetical protein
MHAAQRPTGVRFQAGDPLAGMQLGLVKKLDIPNERRGLVEKLRLAPHQLFNQRFLVPLIAEDLSLCRREIGFGNLLVTVQPI